MARGKKRRTSKKKRSVKGFSIGRAKKDSYDFIEHMWAEHGVVRIITKDGQESTLTPTMAALRCQAINEMKLPKWHSDKRNKFVEKAIRVIREAKHQIENKHENKATEGIQNVLSGLTAEGKLRPQTTDEDELVQKYIFQFPMIHEQDVRAILREKTLDMPRKELLMGEINRQNFAKANFKIAGEQS